MPFKLESASLRVTYAPADAASNPTCLSKYLFLMGWVGPSAQWETLNFTLSWKRRDSVLTSVLSIFPASLRVPER